MTRRRLPNRRAEETIEIRYGNQAYLVSVGFYETAEEIEAGARPTVGEMFIAAGKAGTDVNTMMHDTSVANSIALQHGATVQELSGAFLRNEDDTPAGLMSTILDEIARRWP